MWIESFSFAPFTLTNKRNSLIIRHITWKINVAYKYLCTYWTPKILIRILEYIALIYIYKHKSRSIKTRIVFTNIDNMDFWIYKTKWKRLLKVNLMFTKSSFFQKNAFFWTLPHFGDFFSSFEGGKLVKNAHRQRAEGQKIVFKKIGILEKNRPIFLHIFTVFVLKYVLFLAFWVSFGVCF